MRERVPAGVQLDSRGKEPQPQSGYSRNRASYSTNISVQTARRWPLSHRASGTSEAAHALRQSSFLHPYPVFLVTDRECECCGAKRVHKKLYYTTDHCRTRPALTATYQTHSNIIRISSIFFFIMHSEFVLLPFFHCKKN